MDMMKGGTDPPSYDEAVQAPGSGASSREVRAPQGYSGQPFYQAQQGYQNPQDYSVQHASRAQHGYQGPQRCSEQYASQAQQGYQSPQSYSVQYASQAQQGYPAPPGYPPPQDYRLQQAYLPHQTYPQQLLAGPRYFPIVIPQASKTFSGVTFSPFVRAYPRTLAQANPPLPKDEFMRFLDGLNEAYIASPYIQALKLAGTVTSFVPLATAQIVGSSVSLGAGAASAATSYARTRKFVKNANESIFQPRGLQLRVLSTQDMVARIGMEGEQIRLPPLPEFSGEPQGEDRMGDPRERWLQALGPRVAPLDWDVAAATEQQGWLKKAGAWQAKRQHDKQTKDLRKEREDAAKDGHRSTAGVNKKRREAEKKVGEIQRKVAEVEAKAASEMQRKGDKDGGREAMKIEADKQKELSKLQREMEKEWRGYEKEERKGVKDSQKDGDEGKEKEHEIVQKVRWLVITPSLDTPVNDQDIDAGVEDVQ